MFPNTEGGSQMDCISRSETVMRAVELIFDKKEASQIYVKLVSIEQPVHFLSFEEAWTRFGSVGPLMEFVYLISQNESLHDRLSSQIAKLQDMVREGKMAQDELQLLRMVAVASAYDARLDAKLLSEILKLPEPARTMDLFEKEYLLRQSSDKKYVEGLHPIRSAILVKLLSDDIS